MQLLLGVIAPGGPALLGNELGIGVRTYLGRKGPEMTSRYAHTASGLEKISISNAVLSPFGSEGMAESRRFATQRKKNKKRSFHT